MILQTRSALAAVAQPSTQFRRCDGRRRTPSVSSCTTSTRLTLSLFKISIYSLGSWSSSSAQRAHGKCLVGELSPAGMAAARLDYVAPWWTYWLHNFPHFDYLFQPVDNAFRPEEQSYQQVGGRARGISNASHRPKRVCALFNLILDVPQRFFSPSFSSEKVVFRCSGVALGSGS